MTWQRTARLGVAVALVVFALVLYFAIGRRPPAPPQAVVGRSDPAAIVETAPGTLTLANGETIAFERQLTYADGRSVFHAVTLTTRDQHEREIVVTAREATRRAPQEDSSRLGEVVMKGDVHVTTSDGLDLRTAEATYSDRTRMLRTADRVEFSRDRLSGSGTGATYDRASAALWLLADARVDLAPDEQGGGGLAATAGSAGLERPQHILRLVGNAHIERTDRAIDAAEGTLRLSDDDKRLTRAELRGGARVARPDASPGSPAEMRGDSIDLDYAEDGTSLRQAVLAGATATTGIDLAGEKGQAGGRIRGWRLVVELAPDGGTISRLEARSSVVLELPAAGEGRAQTIRATTLDAEGGPPDGLRSARFGGGVEYREVGVAQKSGGRAERIARSTSLDVALLPQLSGTGAAQFHGAVTFTDGTWRGESTEAIYDPGPGTLLLTGVKEQTGPPPRHAGPPARLSDDRVTIDAQTIRLALDTRRLTADTGVQSVFRPPAANRAASAAAGRLPAMLDSRQTLYVTAAELVYDGAASVAAFSGGARLWQGESQVRADSITLDDRAGDLTASGAVRSTLMLDDAPRTGSPKGARWTTGEAKELRYVEADRTLTYTGKAHVVGGQGDINAERVEIVLGRTGRGMAKAEAYDEITARLEGGYTITGKRLTYLVEEQRYVVQGQPVRVVEQKPDGCKETVGRLLTLERSTDTITVVGTEGNRSKSLPVPCTERRR